MSSNGEMSDPDSSSLEPNINLDPAITASVHPGPERVVHKCKEYIRRPGIRAAQDPSVIWSLGEEYERKQERFWRCGICTKTKMLAIQKGTSSALRHLRKYHKIDKMGRRIQPKHTTIVEAISGAARTVTQVVTRFNANTFRYLLIRWIVTMHIALTCVESDTFQDWVLYIAPGLEVYLVKSANTIKRWILWEFAKQRRYVKQELANARSRIHVSFDCWTSPNTKGLVGVVFHFLDKDLKVRSLLAGMKRVRGAHTGENIAEAVIPIIKEMVSIDRLGFFMGDNASENGTAIRAIITHLCPNEKDPNSRRVRCLGHIINLAAKAFLFGKDADAFEEESQTKKERARFEAVRELWRKKGPVGKFHNTVSFIRKNPQRREAFLETCGSGITSEIKGERRYIFQLFMPRLRANLKHWLIALPVQI